MTDSMTRDRAQPRNVARRAGIFVLIVNVLLFPLYWNRYPILFNDTGTYLEAFRNFASFLHPPLDRPVFYSFFIYLASLGRRTLYLVPIVQALVEGELISSMLFEFEGDWPKIILSALALPLSFLAIMTSCVEPDVWLIIGFTAVLAATFNRRRLYYTGFVVFCSTLFAPANGVIIAASSFLLLGIVLAIMRKRHRHLILPFAVAFIAGCVGYATLAVEDYVAFRIPSPITASSLFLFARFNASHIGPQELSAVCAQPANVGLPPCRAVDRYAGIGVNKFLWRNNGFHIWTLNNIHFYAALDRQIEAKHWAQIIAMDLHDAIKLSLKLPKNMDQFYGRRTIPALKAVREFHLDDQRAQLARQHWPSNTFSYLEVSPYIEGLFMIYCLLTYWRSERDQASDLLVGVYASFAVATFLLNSLIDGLSQTAFRYNAKGISVFLILGIGLLALSRRSIQPVKSLNL